MDDDTDVPKQEVYSAYESWATDHGLEIPTNQWISQQLSDRVNIGRGRRRIDGDLTRTFTGITLDKDEGSE